MNKGKDVKQTEFVRDMIWAATARYHSHTTNLTSRDTIDSPIEDQIDSLICW